MRPSARFWIILSLLISDVIGINLGFVGSYALLYRREIATTWQSSTLDRAPLFVLLLNLACAAIFISNRLYAFKRGASRVDEAYKIFVASTIATLVASVIASLTGVAFTATNLVTAWLASTALVVLLRNIHRTMVHLLRKRGFDRTRTLIVGSGPTGQMIAQTIMAAPHLGYDVQGFLSDTEPIGTLHGSVPVLGRSADIRRVVRVCRINEVLVCVSNIDSHDILELVAACEAEPVAIKIYPDTFQIITNNEVSIGDLGGLPLMSIKSSPLDLGWNRFLKRALDVAGSLVGLIFLSPLLVLLAILVKLDSHGPAFFVQERVGVNGQPFPMIKFRSMRTDAEQLARWTVPDDPRKTRLGNFIRRWSLDELPQLINVFLGDMSLVGPRPEQPIFVEQFRQQIPHYMRRHKEKAGMTGWAQVNGLRGDTSIEERVRYDLYYVENWSVLFDIKIIARQLVTLFRKHNNAY
ncbi:MAG: undecaprenyl-phosphate glucose phosphotransferase [Chloroflexota bacterium]|nr:undecaprenyl-phosphate glucose phosphotransferase [Chloroflexota bacterium]